MSPLALCFNLLPLLSHMFDELKKLILSYTLFGAGKYISFFYRKSAIVIL